MIGERIGGFSSLFHPGLLLTRRASSNRSGRGVIIPRVHVFFVCVWTDGCMAGCLDDTRRSSPHQGKLVRDSSVWGKLGTKAQCRKQLVAVVVLDDLSDSPQRHGVVIQLVWAHVVERGGLGRVAWDPNGSTQ